MKKIIALTFVTAVLLSGCNKNTNNIDVTETSTQISDTSISTLTTEVTTVTIKTVSSEPTVINIPPSDLSDEKLDLWNSIAEQVDKEIVFYDIADYDNDGSLEMFAVVGWVEEDEDIYSSVFLVDVKTHYAVGNIWFASDKGTEKLTANIMEDYFAGEIWFMEFGFDKYLIYEVNSATGLPFDIYGVRNGELFISEISGIGMALRYNEYGELIYRHSTYDIYTTGESMNGIAHSWKPYWLYYDEEVRDFKEYGGIKITLEQFMTFKNAKSVIDLTEGNEITAIYYRDNGIINVNHRIYEDNNDYYSNSYIIVHYSGKEIISMENEDGIYLPALCPEIAVYPDITELFD